MHFSESFLKKVLIRGEKMESFASNQIVPIATNAMFKALQKNEHDGLNNFVESLSINYSIQTEAVLLRMLKPGADEFDQMAKSIEEKLFKASDMTVMPFSWAGPKAHALLLIVKPNDLRSGYYTLTVLNTGAGVNYHKSIPDHENEIYPSLIRPWKIFKDVPQDELTNNDHWFVRALGLLNDPNYMTISAASAGTADKYMYESILGNLKQYQEDELIPEEDDRFMRMQRSGSCAYSSIVAGVLHETENKEEFLKFRFLYGIELLETFLEKYSDHEIVKSIARDAYEPMMHYLLKRVISGLALHALEYVESIDGGQFKISALIGKRKHESKSNPKTITISNDELRSALKRTITLASRVRKIIEDNPVDGNTSIIPKIADIENANIHRLESRRKFAGGKFILKHEDINKLKVTEENWPGNEHAYIKDVTEYDDFLNSDPKEVSDFRAIIKAIRHKSEDMSFVDTVMGTYVFDFLRKFGPVFRNVVKSCNNYLHLQGFVEDIRMIIQNFVEESLLVMDLEDFAAMAQLVNIIWEISAQIDSNSSLEYRLGLYNFSAPHTDFNNFIINQKIDHQGDSINDKCTAKVMAVGFTIPLIPGYERTVISLDSCAAIPSWLSTENEVDAWIMLESAKAEMTPTAQKPRLFDPKTLFPEVDLSIFVDATVQSLPEGFKIILEKIANREPGNIHTVQALYYNGNPLTRKILALAGRPYLVRHYPHFYHTLASFLFFYKGLWRRPSGSLELLNGEALADLHSKSLHQLFPLRGYGKSKRQPNGYEALKELNYKRNVAVNELINYKNLSFTQNLDKTFFGNKFCAMRASETLQEPEGAARFYSFLANMEGSKSCALFEIPELVYIADRSMGLRKNFDSSIKGNSAYNSQLIDRVINSMTLSIDSEFGYFDRYFEIMSVNRKERHLKRTLIASSVLVRFVDRLVFWKLACVECDSTKFVKLLGNLYSEWSKYSSFAGDLEIAEDLISKVNLFLYTIINSVEKLQKKESSNSTLTSLFFKHSRYNLKQEAKESDSADLFHATKVIHYFMAAAFTPKTTPTKIYNLLDKLPKILRIRPAKLSTKEAADIVLKHIGKEMVARFENINNAAEEKKEEFDPAKWEFSISSDFEFVEIKKADSKSKIPFVLLRLSTAKIIFKGVPVVHRSKIYNNPVFLNFFNEKDLPYARNGSIKPIGNYVGYSLADFRGTGQNFLFLSSGSSEDMDIIINYNNERWLWVKGESKEFKAIAEPIRLINYKGIRIFKQVLTDANKIRTIFIRENESIPFMTLDIESIKDHENSKFVAQLPFVKELATLISSDEHPKYLPKAFSTFSRAEIVSLWRKDDGKIVIMYGSYRLDGDQNPVVFEEQIEEATGNTIFVLMNNPSWCLDEKQILGPEDNGFILHGTIKIRSVNDAETKSILLSNFKWKRKFKAGVNQFDPDLDLDALVPVKIMKLSDGDIMPSDRLQRLQLAYKMMVNINTDMARTLIHPIISIDQNSAFTSEEFTVLRWIIDLDIPNPEIHALKMLAAAHIMINSINYPKSFAKNAHRTLKAYQKLFRKLSVDYLFAVREITDKFYLHRNFPEILEPFVFSAMFKEPIKIRNVVTKSNFNELPYDELQSILILKANNLMADVIRCVSKKDEAIFEFALDASDQTEAFKKRKKEMEDPLYTESFGYDPYNFNYAKTLDSSNFWSLLDMLNRDNIDPYSRIHFKSGELQQQFSVPSSAFDFDLILYCMSQDNEIKSVLTRIANNRGTLLMNDLYEHGSPVIIKCYRNYYQTFIDKYLVVPISLDPSLTDISQTEQIFKADLKSREFSEDFQSLDDHENFVDDQILKLFKAAVDAIRKISDAKSLSLKGSSDSKYLPDILNPRLAFKKLVFSIKNYIESDPINGGARIQVGSDEMNQIISAIDPVDTSLTTKIPELNEKLELMAVELAKMTRVDEEADDADVVTILTSLTNLKKSKVFSDLYACHYSFSDDCYIKKFPHITSRTTIKKIREMTFDFYTTAVMMDYLKLIQKEITEIKAVKESISLDALENFVAELKKLDHFDKRVRIPGILNLEYRSGTLRLREEQLADLELLKERSTDSTGGKGLFKSTVLQRMMAAGKTLVLGTLATVMKAREPKVLSILVPPSSLFQSNAASMQSRTYKFFKSRGNVLNFDRLAIPRNENAADTIINFLTWIQSNIKRLVESRDYLLMSPDSLQSFLNSFIEFIDVYSKVTYKRGLTTEEMIPKYEEILQHFAKIYDIFQTQSSIILDEIDMTMNPKRELNYPTTSREKFNPHAIVLTTDLLEFTIFSAKIRSNKLNILRNNQAALTDKGYAEIVGAWMEYIEKSLDNNVSVWKQRLLSSEHSIVTKEWIMRFLRSQSPWEFIEEIKKVIEDDPDNLARMNAIIIIRRQIDFYLQEAFKSTVKEHYGPAGPARSFIKFAVPYVAANTPSDSSLFADRWETLNKSLLMVAVSAFEETDIVEFIRWLKERINAETKSAGIVEHSATYQNFISLIPGLNPLMIDHENASDTHRILTALNKKHRASIRLIFSFHLDTVISTLDFPTEQITSNALHMCSMFTSIQGYSGTIDNINILPSDVVIQAFEDNAKNEKNNGGIVKKLIDDSEKQIVPVAAKFESFTNARKAIQALFKAVPEDKKASLSALIDVGAFLKNFKNAKIAESILKVTKSRIRCVIYYDEKSNMLQYVVAGETGSADKSEKLTPETTSKSKLKLKFTHGQLTLSDPESIERTTGFKLHERFTYYDQRHITGSDILQPPNAWALLTFGSRNLLRDILQGALRMRQFMTSQKVQLVITEDVIDYYNSVLSGEQGSGGAKAEGKTELLVSDVITLSALNEDDKQSRENVALTFIKLDVKLRESLMKQLAADFLKGNFKKATANFNKARALFIRNFSEKPISWIRQNVFVPPLQSIDSFKNFRKDLVPPEMMKELDPLTADCNEEIKNGKINRSVLCFTRENLPLFDNSEDVATEMQLELNTVQLSEFEVETVTDGTKFLDEPITYKRFKLTECGVLKDNSKFNGITKTNMKSKNVIRFDEIIKEDMQDAHVIQLLKSGLFDMNSDDMKKQTFISRDLINIVNVIGQYPLDIFDFFNHDGTHFFVANATNRNFVMLISNDIAQEILTSEYNCGNMGSWYLTDLKGIILRSGGISADPSKIAGTTIFDRIKQDSFKRQIFNLLVLNGSLLQLSSQPQMKDLFFGHWITENAETKLTLLVTRMKVLHRKNQFIYSDEDALMSVISKILKGDGDAINQLINQTFEQKDDDAEDDNKSILSTESTNEEAKKASGVYDKVSIQAEDKMVSEAGDDASIYANVIDADSNSEASASENELTDKEEDSSSDEDEGKKNVGGGGSGGGGGGDSRKEDRKAVDMLDAEELEIMADDRKVTMNPDVVQAMENYGIEDIEDIDENNLPASRKNADDSQNGNKSVNRGSKSDSSTDKADYPVPVADDIGAYNTRLGGFIMVLIIVILGGAVYLVYRCRSDEPEDDQYGLGPNYDGGNADEFYGDFNEIPPPRYEDASQNNGNNGYSQGYPHHQAQAQSHAQSHAYQGYQGYRPSNNNPYSRNN